jgi:hypothetical protein
MVQQTQLTSYTDWSVCAGDRTVVCSVDENCGTHSVKTHICELGDYVWSGSARPVPRRCRARR